MPATSTNIIVTDKGFARDTFAGDSVTLEGLSERAGTAPVALNLPQTADVNDVLPVLGHVALIRVAFPAFNDGRGFTLARRLRLAGYRGSLYAVGHVIADQYAMARRAGFDAVEISPDLAARQPQDQWQFRADWQSHDYQSRLRARSAASIAAE